MIVVREDKEGSIARIGGNPVLTSLDGERKARLRVILHESWSAEDRAAFGIYLVDPVAVPDGKQIDGAVTFKREGAGIAARASLKDVPARQTETPTVGAEDALAGWAASLGLTLSDVRAVLAGRISITDRVR